MIKIAETRLQGKILVQVYTVTLLNMTLVYQL